MKPNVADNTARIVRLIREKPGISRADIARAMKLSNPSVSIIVERLLTEKLVFETGKGVSGGGKCPTLLEFNPNSFFTIGLDIGSTRCIRGVLCDGNGRIVTRKEIPFGQNQFSEISEKTVSLIKTLQQFALAAVKGAGVAVSGIVAPETNEIVFSANFDFSHKNFAGFIHEQTNIPVLIENRARLAAMTEGISGAAADCKDYIYISTGRSIGSAFSTSGHVFTGCSGAFGEIRNLPVHWEENGRLHVAALETAAGEESLVNSGAVALGKEIQFNELLQEYQAGNPSCVELVKHNAKLIAQAAAVLCCILDVPLILLGGKMKDFGPDYFKEINLELCQQLAGSSRKVRVEASHYGSIGSCLGASFMMMNRLINTLNKTNIAAFGKEK